MQRLPSTERYFDERMPFVIPKIDDPNTQTCVGFTSDLLTLPQADKASIVWMKPDAYLKLVDPNFRVHPREFDWLREQIRIGRCFAPLLVHPDAERSYGALPHEGRHRAWLACELGVARVPVVLARRTPNYWKRHRHRYTVKMHDE